MVRPARTLASKLSCKGTARGKAIKVPRQHCLHRFIDSVRDRLRAFALLFSAAMDEKLPYNDGPILDVFIANGGMKEATAESSMRST